MKKICIVTTIAGTLRAFVLEASKYLHNVGGYDITFICNYDSKFEEELPDYIHYIPVNMKRGFNIRSFSAIKKMRKIFEKEKFDMVQYSTPNAAFYASIAAKKAKVPIRLYCQWGMLYVSRKGIMRRLFKFMEKMICKNSTYIQPDSYCNLEFCRKEGLYNETNSGVVWNGSAKGINLDKFDVSKKEEYNEEIRQKYGIKKDDIVVGTVGRLGREKGSNELIKAFKIINKKHSNTKLLFVGRLEKENTIESNVLKYFYECDDIIKTGYVSDVEKYLSAMNVFILPSYREGFGLSAIEASAMEVPVVVTEHPGPANAVVNKKTGFRIKIRSVDEIVNAFDLIMSNKEISEAMAKNARSYIENCFEEKIFMQKYLENRRELLGDSK